MDLRQRKRLLNMPRFDTGLDEIRQQATTQYDPYQLNLKGIGNSYQQQIAQDVSQMVGPNTPLGTGERHFGSKGIVGTSNDKFNATLSKGIGIAQSALSMFNGLQSSLNVKSSDQLLAEAGSSNQSVMGVNYDQQNAVDGSQDLKEQTSKGISNTVNSTMSGVSAGASVGGPIGAVVGGVVGLGSGLFGLFGGRNKLKKRIRNAKLGAVQKQQFQRASAMTTGIQNQYALRFGDTSTGILYS